MVSFKLVEKLGGFCHGKSRMTETKRLITISSFECIMWLAVLLYISLSEIKTTKFANFEPRKKRKWLNFELTLWIDFVSMPIYFTTCLLYF